MSTDQAAPPRRGLLGRAIELHPQVSVRPEPFGALAYHYGNRRLVFLRHHDLLAVVHALAEHDSLAAALTACEVAPSRWPSFEKAFADLLAGEIVRER